LLFCLFIVPAAAQTPPPQCTRSGASHPPSPQVLAARQQERQACAADMAKFCNDVPPGCGQRMQCLRAHSPQVSSNCSSAMIAVRAAARAAH
jgi:hypothetical protein